jgi:hypothetical protein
MKAKMTKRDLSNILADLAGELVTVNEERDRLFAQDEYTAEESEYYNSLHDRATHLEGCMDEAMTDFRRRNWTANEWNTYDLVAANID